MGLLVVYRYMLVTIPFFGPLGIVEPIQCAYQITGNTSNSLERGTGLFGAAAFRARTVDNAGETTDWVTINGMVD